MLPNPASSFLATLKIDIHPSSNNMPIGWNSPLCLLCTKAVGYKWVLQQGNCKNAFCNASLPDDKLQTVQPPLSDPFHTKDEYWLLNKTLYSLCCLHHHWYNKITEILSHWTLHSSAWSLPLLQGCTHWQYLVQPNHPCPCPCWHLCWWSQRKTTPILSYCWFHGQCRLVLGHCLHLATSLQLQCLCPSLTISIHQVHCSWLCH